MIIWFERFIWATILLLFGGVGFLGFVFGARSDIRDEDIKSERKSVAELNKMMAQRIQAEKTDYAMIRYEGKKPARPKTGGAPPAAAPSGDGSQAAATEGDAESAEAGGEPVVNNLMDDYDPFPLFNKYQGQITDVLEISPELMIKYSNPNEVSHLAMQASSYYVDLSDGRVGLQLDEIDEGSILGSKLDLQNGDIIISVNGRDLPEDVEGAWDMYNEFKAANLKEAVVELIRNGQRRVVYYPIR